MIEMNTLAVSFLALKENAVHETVFMDFTYIEKKLANNLDF